MTGVTEPRLLRSGTHVTTPLLSSRGSDVAGKIADEIHSHGFFVMDNFLPENHYQNLRTTIQALHQDGSFKSAKIGQNTRANHVPSIRNDQIYWLDEHMPNTAVQAYFTEMDNIKRTLNQSLFLGLNNIESHFAVYQPGNFYKKHVDQFLTTMDRRISCVYYLNEHWQPEHSGELVLYHQDNNPPVNIEPYGNRLVCFTSDLPHEVNTTYHTRYSIAGWLKVRGMGV